MGAIEERRRAAQERAKQLDSLNLDGAQTTITARRAQAMAAAQLRDSGGRVGAPTPQNDADKEFEQKYAGDSDFMKGVKSIGVTAAATLPMVVDTVGAAVKDLAHDRENADIRGTEEYKALAQEYRRLRGLKSTLNPKSGDYKARVAEIEKQMAENESKRAAMMKRTAIDPDSTGMQMMREANWLREEATEDLSGAGKFLANTALSIGQNLAVLPTAAINPAVPLVAMGAMSGAQKAYEVTEAGGYASDALARGAISGSVEAFTEKMGIDNLLDIIKTGGKTAVANMLKQAGAEAGEEAVSYVMNFAADKAAKDPNATWSWAELAESAASGGLSGLFFGGAGTTVNAGINAARQKAVDTLNGEALRKANETLDLIAAGKNYAEGSKSRKLADSYEAKIMSADNSATVISDSQYGRLLRVMAQEVDSAGPKSAQVKEAAVQAMHPGTKVMSPSATAFMDAGDNATAADTKSAIMDRILDGDTGLTDADIKSLDLDAPSTREALTALTGLEFTAEMDGKEVLAQVHTAVEAAADVQRKQAALAQSSVDQVLAQAQAQAQQAEARMAQQVQPVEQDTAQPIAQAESVESMDGDSVMVTGGGNVSKADFYAHYEAQGAERSEIDRYWRSAQEANLFGTEYPMTGYEGVRHSVKKAKKANAEPVKARGADADAQATKGAPAQEASQNASTRPAKERGLNAAQAMAEKVANDAVKGSKRIKSVSIRYSADLIAEGKKGFGEDENGFYDKETGTIVLNGDRLTNARAVLTTLGHELVHDARYGDTDIVNDVLGFAEEQYSAEKVQADLDERRRTYIDFLVEQKGYSREKAEATVDLDYAREELAADYMGEILGSTDALYQLADKNPGLVQKARAAAERMAVRLATGKSVQAKAMRNEAQLLVDRLDRALRSVESRDTMKKNEEVRSSVGRKADEPRTERSDETVGRESEAVRGVRGSDTGEQSRGGALGGKNPGGWYNLAVGEVIPGRDSAASRVVANVAEYGVRGRVFPEKVLGRIGNKSGFSREGEIYIPAEIESDVVENFSCHETIHTMKQNDFDPYRRFVMRVESKLNPGEIRDALLRQMMDHRKLSGAFEDLGLSDQFDVLDEFCATTRGMYAMAPEAFSGKLGEAYKDIVAFISDIDALLEQYKKWNTEKEGTPSEHGEDAFSVRHSLGALPGFRGISERKLRQIAESPEFKAWFHDGNGELIDPKTGLPLVLYHGTGMAGYTRFESQPNSEPGFWFAKHMATSDSEGYTGRQAGEEATREFRPRAPKSWKKMVEYIESEYQQLLIEYDDYTGMYTVSDAESWEPLGAYKPTKAGLAKLDRDLQDLAATEEPGMRGMRNPGVYQVFLSMENPFVVDCGGAVWHEISVDAIRDAELRGAVEVDRFGQTTTNSIVRAAQQAGYDGVILKNVRDGRSGEPGDLQNADTPQEVIDILDAHHNFGAPDAYAALDVYADMGVLPGLSGQEAEVLSNYVENFIEGDAGAMGVADDDFVVFDSAQVKSVHNTGTFDPEDPDIRFSVGTDTLKAVQGLGRKSIAELTERELAGLDELRHYYEATLGRKSPFYRAEHGDWREYDATPVLTAKQAGKERGPVRNEDTLWEVNVSRKVFDENIHGGATSREATAYLDYIRDIIKHAVLLDSYTADKQKSANTLLMHSFYAVADLGEGPELLKLYVEEMYDPNSADTKKRAYQLQNIEKQRPGVVGSDQGPSLITPTADIRTVADLVRVVKERDKNYRGYYKGQPRYSVSRNAPSWDRQVSMLLSGHFDKLFKGDGNRKSVMYVAKEPTALLQSMGLSDLPLIMTQSHARDILRQRWDAEGNELDGHAHQLSEEQLRKVPEYIQNPVMVMASNPTGKAKGGLVLVTDDTDPMGNPIIVTIKADQPNFTYDGASGPAHFVNVYGRENFDYMLDAALKNGDVLYVDKEKAQTTPFGAAYSLPQRTRDLDSKAIIREKDPTVKPAERRFSAGKKGNPVKTGGNTGNVNPDTGYERGSLADSFMRVLKTGDRKGALDMLEQAAQQLAQAEADRAEQRKQQRVSDVFLHRNLTEDAIERNKRVIEELAEKYGAIPQTSAAQREVRLPKQIDDTTKVRSFIQTLEAAQVTTEDVRNTLEADILDGTAGTTYTPITDNAALREAREAFKNKTKFDEARRKWTSLVESGEMPSKQDIAIAEALYAQACAEGQVYEAQKLAAEIAAVGTQAGQVVQAMTLVKRMTPAGQLYYIQKAVDRLNAEKAQKDRNVQLKIDPKLAEQLLKAKNKEEMDAALDAITQHLADQMPVTIYDKWNAWRYLAMLGNPRTHVRNLFGNAIFTPARLIKDVAAMGMESAAVKAGKMSTQERTKGIADKALRDFARQDAEVMEDELRGGGKYDTKEMIRDKRRIFKNGLVHTAEKLNSGLLEGEDWLFLRSAYTHALSGFLAARGFTAEQVSGPNSTKEGRAALDAGRVYAINEAKKATYRDASKVAQWINHTARNSGPVGSILIGGLMPFTKTPVNIVKRGLEYSPVGVLTTVAKGAKQLKSGEMTAAEFIDGMAAGLTGTAILGLGYFLARAGLLVGGLGDEDEDKFEELQGNQEYSIRVGGQSYTIDWMAPTVLPLFVGEAIHRLSEQEGLDGWEMLEASMGLLDPVMSLSMLDGLNSTLSAVKYDTGEPIPAILQTIFGSYVSQGVPTVLGAVARTIDDSRRTSFTPKGQTSVQRWASRLWQSSFVGKIPFASEGRMAYVDEWGRTDTESSVLMRAIENFVSPGYINPLKESPLEDELGRLAKATGDNGVYPNRAQKYFSVDGKEYVMTQDEYQEHLLYRGQKSYALVSDITTSPTYAGLDDKTRAKAVELAYDYAANMAKVNTAPAYSADKWMVKLAQYEAQGGDAAEYLMLRAQSKISGMSLTEQTLSGDEPGTYDAAEVIFMERTQPTSFTDPWLKGYEYVMDDAQQARYAQTYHDLFVPAYVELAQDEEFLSASLAERKSVVSDLGSDINAETKELMADWLEEQGVESTEKQ